MKMQYEYNVGGIKVGTREAARIVQRSFRSLSTQSLTTDGKTPVVPRIVQKLTVERVVR
jgi:hypothetical protein